MYLSAEPNHLLLIYLFIATLRLPDAKIRLYWWRQQSWDLTSLLFYMVDLKEILVASHAILDVLFLKPSQRSAVLSSLCRSISQSDYRVCLPNIFIWRPCGLKEPLVSVWTCVSSVEMRHSLFSHRGLKSWLHSVCSTNM